MADLMQSDGGRPTLLKAEDVALQLGLSTSHAYRLLRSGRIETVRFGGVVRVTQSAIDEFIARHTERPLSA